MLPDLRHYSAYLLASWLMICIVDKLKIEILDNMHSLGGDRGSWLGKLRGGGGRMWPGRIEGGGEIPDST
jgi:hypothetical protein